MSDAETRALGRAAAFLLIASTLRWGWGVVDASAGPSAQDETTELLERSRALAADRQERDRPLAPSERVDPNRAPAAEIDRLPGVGPATARAVVASRERDGPFRRPEDLTRVRGVGPATLARIRPHLDFSEPAPATLGAAARRQEVHSPGSPRRVDLNRAGEAELLTLPGVGPALARRIIEARAERPFASPDELIRVRGIGPATLARISDLVVAGR